MFRSLIQQSRAAGKPYTPPTLMPTAPVDASHLEIQPEQQAIQDAARQAQAPMSVTDRIRAFREGYETPGLRPEKQDPRPSRQYIDPTPPRYLR